MVAKIKIIIPVATNRWNKSVDDFCKKVARPGTEIGVTNLEKGPKSIESDFDEAFAEPYVVEEVIKAERNGYNAAVIFCFSNPGLFAARAAVDILVVGIGEAAELLAMSLGHKFTIIGTVDSAIKRHEIKAKQLGTIEKLASVRCVGIHVLDLDKDREKLRQAVLFESRRAVENDGTDVIVLGCGGMLNLAPQISKELNTPVIDPCLAGLKLAELFCELGLTPSKLAFPKPEFNKLKK